MEGSNGAVMTACDIQVDGKSGPGRPKMTWKQLTERDCREWKLSAINPHDRHTWRSGVRPVMRAASQLPGRMLTDVAVAHVPAALIKNLMMMMMMMMMMMSAAKEFFGKHCNDVVFLMYHVRIKIIFLCCELSSNNAMCCQADANIKSLWLYRSELIFRNLPSNTMRYLTKIHSTEKFLK